MKKVKVSKCSKGGGQNLPGTRAEFANSGHTFFSVFEKGGEHFFRFSKKGVNEFLVLKLGMEEVPFGTKTPRNSCMVQD